MNKKADLFKPAIYVLTAFLLFITLLTAVFDLTLFYICAAIVLGLLSYLMLYLRKADEEVEEFIHTLASSVNNLQNESVVGFSLPLVVVGENAEIYWYNDKAQELLENSETKAYGKNLFAYTTKFDFLAPCPKQGFETKLFGRLYSVYTGNTASTGGEKLTALYFVDDDEFKRIKETYIKTRPAIAIIEVDNYEEMLQNAKETERIQIASKIDYEIEKYAADHCALLNKLEKDRYVVVIEDCQIEKMINSRFDILDKIREIASADGVPSTISVGVSRETKNYVEGYKSAKQALDMALGRGGDQAAVKTQNGYDFYGGASKGVEKRTKVKTRIIASAMRELILTSDHVIIMGHSFADLDSFGSAVGMLRAVLQLGKTAHIAISRDKNLVRPLYDRLLKNGYNNLFVEPEDLMDSITPQTLLIVVDTHLDYILESPALYKKCENVIVIDHHRKMVNHINNTVIFYHEPYASSASEMVTELVQYFGEEVHISRWEAEALLSGIMLDTKNFVIKTGVRTFEAAAYLRKLGADTVEVRKLFSFSLESYQQRTRLVSGAEVYRGCAIADTQADIEDIKIVAPQAADELLNISGVTASFVLYEYDGGTSISARSMGEVNVQLIMEELGGGGHLTMAGAQLAGLQIEEARQELLKAIDNHFDKEKPKDNQ